MDQLMDTQNCIFFPQARQASVDVDDMERAAKSSAAVARKEPAPNPYRKLALSVQKLEAFAHEVAQQHKAYQLTRNGSTTRPTGFGTLAGEPQCKAFI